MPNYQKQKKGFGLLEALIGVALFSVILVSMVIAFQNIAVLQKSLTARIQAEFLLEEGVEAVRSIRDTDWTTISSATADTPYYLDFDTVSKSFDLTAGKNQIDNFYRWVEFSPVYRDGNDDIAGSGTIDSGTKKVTVSVEWLTGGASTTKQLSAYITDIFSE